MVDQAGATNHADEQAIQPAWVGYAVTLVLEIALTAALVLLMPVLEMGRFPIPYVLLSMLIGYFFGTRPAVLSVVAGWVLFTYHFVDPAPGLWPIAANRREWARHYAFFFGVIVISIAAVQARTSQRRIRRLADETMELNRSLTEEIEERTRVEASLRESEQHFRSLFDALPVGAVMVDPVTLEFHQFNDAAAHMLGFTREEFAKRSLRDVEQLHDEVLIRENIVRFLSGERLEFESEFRTKTGEMRDAFVQGQRLQMGGKPYVLATWMDITARKKVEEEIKRLNVGLEERVQIRTAELEASNKELEAFSYSVSHDLRAPLRAIDGFSNALFKQYFDTLDEQGRDYLLRVRAAAQRMAQLIDDIIGLSRAGRAEMNRQRVDLSAMALEILENLRKTQPERMAEIAVQQGLVADADPHLMRIALGNLLDNAWKFTSNRETAVIEVGYLEQDGERVYYVMDNGAGFNPAYADKLFSPFQRLHGDDEFPGTGIGLALVQRIVRRHGGHIWAQSVEEQGSTFYFTLEEASE